MSRPPLPRAHYWPAGSIEVDAIIPGKNRGRWVAAWSEILPNGQAEPLILKREVLRLERARGRVPVFHQSFAEARDAAAGVGPRLYHVPLFLEVEASTPAEAMQHAADWSRDAMDGWDAEGDPIKALLTGDVRDVEALTSSGHGAVGGGA